MSLTAEQIAKRAGKLTASRIGVLMKGDSAGILRLYQEMTGDIAEEDLSDVWPVQLGAVTEQLNLNWYERNNQRLLTRRGEVVDSKDLPWAAATLDGWDDEIKCPVECKHVGGFEPFEIIIDRYQPQIQWQMMVTGAKCCALSVIMGARPPVVDYVDRSEPYIDLLKERGDYFMMCVALRHPPVELAEVPPPIDPKAVINMTGHNVWTHNAITWGANEQFAKDFEEAKKVLKSLVPPEAQRCFGAGIRITRDRAGRLHIRKDS